MDLCGQVSEFDHLCQRFPQGILSTSKIIWDFVDFSVDDKNKLTLDTTQIDQVSISIKLQLNPVAPDFPNGTGIVTNQTLANILQKFQQYTPTGTNFTAYSGLL